MNSVVLIDEDTGNKKHFDSRKEAEEQARNLPGEYKVEAANGSEPGSAEDIDARTPDNVEVVDMSDTKEKMEEGYEERAEASDSDATEEERPPEDIIESIEDGIEHAVEERDEADALDQLGESLETDPLSILPGHMVDNIKGQHAINKRGYAMIAERYGVEVTADIVQFPWENDEGRAVAKATAITEDGKEYQDWATASKDDGDMSEQLIELASTRALKRCVGWATGLGIVSYQELSKELEGNQ
jgi:hypothetical protein